jgi:hypothetical protein
MTVDGCTMDRTDVPFSESIISLVIDGLLDDASSVIARADPRLSGGQARRLVALVRITRNKPEGIAKIEEANRRTYRENGTWLAYVYALGVELMDIERWADAEVVLDELIALSKAKDEFYFLDDARLRRALCLKYLGRRREMEELKAEIPATARAFICREDLGGCVELARDHLV